MSSASATTRAEHPVDRPSSDLSAGGYLAGEHDFGIFQMVGRTFYWKIDYYYYYYYDDTLEGGSKDPSDPGKTTRVLTLMLAEDY